MHLTQRVSQQRMPVAHADVHRERAAQSREPLLEPSRLATRDFRDRRDAAEELVVVRDLFDTLGTDPAAAQHGGQERTNVGETLWAAERHDEDGIEAQK